MIRFHLTLCVMLDIKHMLNTSIKLQYYSLWYRTGVFKYRYVGGYIDTPHTNIIHNGYSKGNQLSQPILSQKYP